MCPRDLAFGLCQDRFHDPFPSDKSRQHGLVTVRQGGNTASALDCLSVHTSPVPSTWFSRVVLLTWEAISAPYNDALAPSPAVCGHKIWKSNEITYLPSRLQHCWVDTHRGEMRAPHYPLHCNPVVVHGCPGGLFCASLPVAWMELPAFPGISLELGLVRKVKMQGLFLNP